MKDYYMLKLLSTLLVTTGLLFAGSAVAAPHDWHGNGSQHQNHDHGNGGGPWHGNGGGQWRGGGDGDRGFGLGALPFLLAPLIAHQDDPCYVWSPSHQLWLDVCVQPNEY